MRPALRSLLSGVRGHLRLGRFRRQLTLAETQHGSAVVKYGEVLMEGFAFTTFPDLDSLDPVSAEAAKDGLPLERFWSGSPHGRWAGAWIVDPNGRPYIEASQLHPMRQAVPAELLLAVERDWLPQLVSARQRCAAELLHLARRYRARGREEFADYEEELATDLTRIGSLQPK